MAPVFMHNGPADTDSPAELKPAANIPIFLLTLSIAACGNGDRALVPIPEVNYDTMSAPVRVQLSEAVEAVAASPDDGMLNGRLAMLLDTYQKPKAAADLYSRARHLQPDRFRWVYLNARALLRLGDDVAGQALLEQALALRPGYPAAELALAELLARSGQTDRALASYRKLIERNPGFAQAQAGLGKLLLAQGNPEAALDPLLTAVALTGRYGEAHYALSQAYRQTGQTELAATHAALFERYRKLGPPANDPLALEIQRLNRSQAGLLQQAMTDTARGRHAEAVERFLAMADAAPDSPAPHVNLIAVYGEMQQYELAYQHAERALELDPESVKLHDNLGVLRMKQGRFDEAVASFRTAAQIDPGYSLPRRNLAVALAAAGKTPEALEQYRVALELEPSDRQTRFLLGRALLDSGQAEAAAEVLQPLTRVTLADTPLHLHTLGLALLGSDRSDEAVPVLERAHRLALTRGLPDAARIASDLARARAGS